MISLHLGIRSPQVCSSCRSTAHGWVLTKPMMDARMDSTVIISSGLVLCGMPLLLMQRSISKLLLSSCICNLIWSSVA